MDNKNRKIYNKALDFHEKGEINKALELCEIALADNLGESEILNFKGIMLYQRGFLNEAVTVWKINVDLNNDSMAKNYIKDAERDEERIKLYKDAEQLLKKSDINKAIELFLECAKSDFNCIKVNTGIAWCYQKKGDYYRAKEYVDKALKIDKNAVTANEIKNQLEGMDLYYGEKKNWTGIGLSIVIAIMLTTGGYLIFSKYKNNNNNNITVTNNNEFEKQHQNENESNNKENVEKDDFNNFDGQSLLSAINNNDYNLTFDCIQNIKVDELSKEESNLYNRAISILKDYGVSSFYEYGLWYFNQGDYENAKDQFYKAYLYSEGHYLNQHIIFYRASTASQQGDKDLTLDMYEKYYELYPNGSYSEGVLYELTLLLADIDRQKAKMYANKLIHNYPNSIYINSKLTNILNE